MKIKNPNDTAHLTARQWAKKGYVKNDDAQGVEMWSNPYCQHKAYYYTEEEVHPATPEELDAYFKPERERRAERRRMLAEQKRQEEERQRLETEQHIQQLKDCISRLDSILFRLVPQVEVQPEVQADLIVIDIETTGLDIEHDEPLQISIIDGDGKTLYNSYLKPLYVSEWTEAMRINHITPEMVADAPNIYEEMPKINSILRQAKKIIGYNHIGFDIPFLESFGAVIPEQAEQIDVMLDFAPVYGDYNEYLGDYKWQKLTTCAAYYHYEWGDDKSHDSLADCRATLHCYHKMQRDRKEEH